MTSNKNIGFIIVLFGLLFAAILLYQFIVPPFYEKQAESQASYSQAPTAIPPHIGPQIHLEETGNSRNKYGWIIVTGNIVNDGTASHSVSGYTDFYDKNGVKFDHILFFVNVDPHGKTSFECTSIDAEKYNGVKYRVYIDDIF